MNIKSRLDKLEKTFGTHDMTDVDLHHVIGGDTNHFYSNGVEISEAEYGTLIRQRLNSPASIQVSISLVDDNVDDVGGYVIW